MKSPRIIELQEVNGHASNGIAPEDDVPQALHSPTCSSSSASFHSDRNPELGRIPKEFTKEFAEFHNTLGAFSDKQEKI